MQLMRRMLIDVALGAGSVTGNRNALTSITINWK